MTSPQTGCSNSWVVPGTLQASKITLPDAPTFTGSLSQCKNDLVGSNKPSITYPTTPVVPTNTSYGVTASSSFFGADSPYSAFDSNTSTFFRSEQKYNDVSNLAVTTLTSNTTVAGEWIQLQCPSPIVLQSYTLLSTTARNSAWTLAGSADGTAWVALDSRTASTATVRTTYNVGNNQACSYFRFIVTAINTFNNSYINELTFTGALNNLAEVAATGAYSSLTGQSNISGNVGINLPGNSVATCPLEVGNTAKITALGFQDDSIINNPTPVQGSVQGSVLSPYVTQSRYGSLYFMGNSSYLTYPSASSTNYDWSAANNTFECFLYVPRLPVANTAQAIFGVGLPYPSSPVNLWSLNLSSNGAVSAYTFNSGQRSLYSNSSILANSWTHLAVTYNKVSNTQSIFVNGSLSGTLTNGSILDTTQLAVSQFTVNGLFPHGAVGFTQDTVVNQNPCYITDLRMARGEVLYTGSSFTVPTTPLTATSNTQLLLRASVGTHGVLETGRLLCGANTIFDLSTNNNNPTPLNNVYASDASPYAGQSMCGSLNMPRIFGSRDAIAYSVLNSSLTAATSNWFTRDFTAETWLNMASWPSTNNAFNIFGKTISQSTADWQLNVSSNGCPRLMYKITDGTRFFPTSNVAIIPSAWNHLAMTYSASNVNLYLNGSRVAQANVYANGTPLISNTSQFIVGSALIATLGGGVSENADNPGTLMTDFRVQSGLAAYTGPTYNIPTAPLSVTANTQLLLRAQRAVVITNNQGGGGGTQTTLAGNVQIAGQLSVSSIVQPAWVNLTLAAGVTNNVGATNALASAYKDASGRVYVRGFVSAPAMTTSGPYQVTICTLPFRPSKEVTWVQASGSTAYGVFVNATGLLSVYQLAGATSSAYYLDGSYALN